jgi:Restriction Enzyme Adenine Methylase Associated
MWPTPACEWSWSIGMQSAGWATSGRCSASTSCSGLTPATLIDSLPTLAKFGRRNLLLRLTEHAAQKPWWNRALLVASSSNDGFNSAEIGWLEGRFYDVLNNAVAARVMNKGRPGDDSISIKDRGVLERYVEPTIAALRAVGAPPDTADQQPSPAGKKRTVYRESVKDLIDADLLKAGTRLRPLRKNLTTTALVLPDGSLDVNGRQYAAVSTAAQSVSGNQSEPGWEFWGAPSGDGSFVSLFTLRDRLRADRPTTTSTPSVRPSSSGPSATGPRAAPVEGPVIKVGVRHKQHYTETVKDLLTAGLLTPGQELRPTRKGKVDRATVLESGHLRIGNTEFASLSAAAKSVSGNSSEPGWEFWALEADGRRVSLFDLRAELRKGSP